MKKSILYIMAIAGCMLTSCNDFLDKSPRDTFTNDPSFWNNANDVASYSNKFYDSYTGYSSGGSFGWFYFKTLSDDQVDGNFADWTFKTIPSTASAWTEGFEEIRRINYMLQGMENSTLANRTYYKAVGRLNRAWQYYQMVRQYGNVQWQNQVILDPEDATIYGERTDRDVVMDSVLNDLNYAIANLSTSTDKTAWSKDMALAMKSDICLYEGTFCKYRTQADNGKAPDAARAKKYLQESAAASDAIIASGTYALTANYGEVYNNLNLNQCKEIIFFRNYEKDMIMHGTVDYTCSSTTINGITKDAFDAFLFTDGKPFATTSCNKDDKAVLNKDGNFSINKALAQRDKRLSVLIDSIICFKGHGWARLNNEGKASGSSEMTSSTGYTIRKYDNLTLEAYYRTNTNTGYTDAPLYWYAVVLLNSAEAKAEMGTITNADLDKTINLLQKRAGLPAMTTAVAADPANNMGVSNLIWEIRRTRRCELMTDNWYRYWDLVRWHQLDKLDSNKYPNINRGANLANMTDDAVKVDADKYMIGTSATRTFHNKYYLYPIPNSQLTLSPATGQNPNW